MPDTIPHELDVAKAIRDGAVQSGTKVMGVWLFDLRITGTGAAYRSDGNEYVWRNPDFYLNEDFVARCNGLSVIFEHHEKTVMDGEIFTDRGVGTVMLPYIKGDEVWGVCRIYDESTVEMLQNHPMSTSPNVVFRTADLTEKVSLEDGSTLLIEGKPAFLDHLAICENGVWDKGGEPNGVNSGEDKERNMADDAEKVKVAEPNDDAPGWVKDVMDAVKGIGSRMDAWEAKSKPDEEKDEPKDEKKDAKKDESSEKEEKEERKEEEKRETSKADTSEIKARLDAIDKNMPKERSDAEVSEMADAQARCDAVATMHGKQARGPMNGETPLAYRRRLANDFKSHSPAWKEIDLALLPDLALRNAENDIYKAAADAAMSSATVPSGTLREIHRNVGGRTITEFAGDSDVWMNRFKLPVQRRISAFPLAQKLGQKGLN